VLSRTRSFPKPLNSPADGSSRIAPQRLPPDRADAGRHRDDLRCEGNYALPGLIRGARMEELAFAEGRGPDPATKDSVTSISGAEDDPLQ